MSIKSVMPSNHLILCHPLLLLLLIFANIRVVSNDSVLHICDPSIGASASASVFPVNIQDRFPLGYTGLISLQSKELSRVFFNTMVQSISSLALSFLYSPTLTSIHDYWKNHNFELTDLFGKVMSLLFNMLSRLVKGEGNGTPLQYCCLENPMDWRSLVGCSP